jgi:ribosomal protein S18 acetylase RimI-like enzyme
MDDSPAEIRPAILDDAAAIADINVRAWRHAYRGVIPDAYLASLDAAELSSKVRETVRRYSTILVAQRDAVVGFSWVSASRDKDASEGTSEVIALYVDPLCERRGVGRALMGESLRVAKADGALRVTLWVLEANGGARGFYAALGFTPDGATKTTDRWGGVSVTELRYVRSCGD